MTASWKRDLLVAAGGLALLVALPAMGASASLRDFIMFGMAYALLSMSRIILRNHVALPWREHCAIHALR